MRMADTKKIRVLHSIAGLLREAFFNTPRNLLHIIFLSIKRFIRDKRLLWAASLTYTTIFSLIPLLSVVFFLFKVFGGFSDFASLVRPYIYKTLAPGAQEKVITVINDLVDNINFATIGAFGTAVLIISVVLLLSEIEYALNEIWIAKNKRSVLYRVAIYWTSLTVGPLLLAVALVMIATLQSYKAVKVIEMYMNVDLFARLPYLLVWIAFTGLYIFMPGTKVKFKSALLGGVIAGTLWHLAGSGFTLYTTKFVFYYPLVYGPLAAIPLFLLWLFISWILFLLGAEIAYHHEHFAFYSAVSHIPQLSTRDREHLTLKILFFIAQRFLCAETPPSLYLIADALNIPAHLAEDLIAPFLKHGIILESSRRRRGYVFSKDLVTIKLADIMDILCRETVLPESYYQDGVGQFLKENAPALHQTDSSGIHDKNLKELLLEMEPGLIRENS